MVKATIKNEALLTQIGATNANDFEAKLVEFLSGHDQLKSQLQEANQKVQAMADNPDISAQLKTLSDSIAAVSGEVNSIKASIVEQISAVKTEVAAIAKSEASKAVGEVVAKTGTSPVAAAPNEGGLPEAPKPGDLKAQWEADKNLRAEFLNDFKAFESFSKAQESGHVYIQAKK